MASPPVRLPPWGFPVLTGVYFIAGKLGLMLAFVHASATAVSPPTGIALAAMLLFGPRVWPAILAGAFLVNVTTAGSVATSLGIAIGNTLEGLVGALLVRRFANGRDAIERAGDMFRFGALAALLGTALSATIGVTSLSLGGFADWSMYGPIWLTWWLGDVVGALVVAPVVLLWSRGVPRVARTDAVGLVALFVAVVAIGWTVFNGLLSPWIVRLPLSFLSIPPLVWAAFRFGPRAVSTAIALLSGIAIWGTLHGLGPFARPSQNESLLLLQAFIATLAMTILPLAAVVRERVRADAALAAIVESTEDAIVGKTLDGVVTSWNASAERLYGYSAREAVGRSISMVIPRELDDDLPGILERLRRGERVDPYETVRLRRDGTRVDVSVTVSPIRDSRGRIVGASAITRDITHRREAAAARRERDLLRYVAALAASAGHAINNPLTVVVGQAQLLARELHGPERHRIDELLDAVWRIRDIVDRLKHVKGIVLTDASEGLPATLDLARSSPSEPAAQR